MAENDELTFRKRGWASYRTEMLMALVVIIIGVAMWLLPTDEEQSQPSLPELPSATSRQEKLPLAPPAGDSAAATDRASGEDAAPRSGDRARAFIKQLRADGQPSEADRVFEEAERMQADGMVDDAYLLYHFAARNGHAEAALLLATQADPAYHSTDSSYLPAAEPEQAYKWYRVAADAGSEEAAARLQALRNRVEQAAADGDEQAQRLMLQWR